MRGAGGWRAGASRKAARSEPDVCSELALKLPCDAAEGPWEHVCTASVAVSCSTVLHGLHLSRHLPAHILAVAASLAAERPEDNALGADAGTDAERLAGGLPARVLGAALGAALLLLGARCYAALLFYLPAVLVGYVAVQPMAPGLTASLGCPPRAASLLGAAAGVLLAYAQRHVAVWLLGFLAGILAFLSLYVGEAPARPLLLSSPPPLLLFLLSRAARLSGGRERAAGTVVLAEVPSQAVLAVGLASGLSGASAALRLEQTQPFKALACAAVGAVLVSDAAGLGAAPPAAQGGACAALVVASAARLLRARWRAQQRQRREAREWLKRRRATVGSAPARGLWGTPRAEEALPGEPGGGGGAAPKQSLRALLSPRRLLSARRRAPAGDKEGRARGEGRAGDGPEGAPDGPRLEANGSSGERERERESESESESRTGSLRGVCAGERAHKRRCTPPARAALGAATHGAWWLPRAWRGGEGAGSKEE
jgi:hypothetical protein